jgi:hypothetical protein
MKLLYSMVVYFTAISVTLTLMIGIPIAVFVYILGARHIGIKLIPIWATAFIYAAYLVGGGRGLDASSCAMDTIICTDL